MNQQEKLEASKELLADYLEYYESEKKEFFDYVENHGIESALRFSDYFRKLDSMKRFLYGFFKNLIEEKDLLSYLTAKREEAKQDLIKNYTMPTSEREARALFFRDFSFLEE